jgi:hypothetical protein
MANNLLIHEIFLIVDEFLTIPKNMPRNFESNAKDGPLVDAMGNINVNDEDGGADLVGLQEACQPLYPCTHSTKLDVITLSMNICIVHGINNKFMDELLSFLHEHLFPPNNCFLSNMYHAIFLFRRVSRMPMPWGSFIPCNKLISNI